MKNLMRYGQITNNIVHNLICDMSGATGNKSPEQTNSVGHYDQ